jgi:hypothetical protein
MLVDVPIKKEFVTYVERIEKGIYKCHLNFDYSIDLDKKLSYQQEYPDLNGFDCYGVCDNYAQIIEQCDELKNENRNFVISITLIEKSKQSPEGGWRWCKWGDYIGNQKSECEYIYDEPKINEVYCYHIYEI